MILHPLLDPAIILYLAASAIPAFFINRWLLKWLQPKRSFGRFMAYLLAALAMAFGYTFLVCFILLKYVWAGG
jgi:hypothetical protein